MTEKDEQQQGGKSSGDANTPSTPSQAEGERGGGEIDRTGRDGVGYGSTGGPGSSSQPTEPNTPSQAEG